MVFLNFISCKIPARPVFFATRVAPLLATMHKRDGLFLNNIPKNIRFLSRFSPVGAALGQNRFWGANLW